MQFFTGSRFQCADFSSWFTMLQNKFVKSFYGNSKAFEDAMAVERDIYSDWDRSANTWMYPWYRSYWF